MEVRSPFARLAFSLAAKWVHPVAAAADSFAGQKQRFRVPWWTKD